MNNAPWWFIAFIVILALWCIYAAIYFTVCLTALYRQWKKGGEQRKQDEQNDREVVKKLINEVRRPIVQYNPLCAKGFGPYCRDCELEMVCGEPKKKGDEGNAIPDTGRPVGEGA